MTKHSVKGLYISLVRMSEHVKNRGYGFSLLSSDYCEWEEEEIAGEEGRNIYNFPETLE